MNNEKIQDLLLKEEKCLKKQKTLKNINSSSFVNIVDVDKTKHVGEVLKDLDLLSDNIVRYLNVPKSVKKKIYKK